jgi:hypothetical protein
MIIDDCGGIVGIYRMEKKSAEFVGIGRERKNGEIVTTLDTLHKTQREVLATKREIKQQLVSVAQVERFWGLIGML